MSAEKPDVSNTPTALRSVATTRTPAPPLTTTEAIRAKAGSWWLGASSWIYRRGVWIAGGIVIAVVAILIFADILDDDDDGRGNRGRED